MTTWRDQLQPASFRGAAFFIDSTDGQIGRRNVIHEYPLRDLPYAEDLGRKAREFSIEAFVIGDDYMAARDKLVAALEAYGSGELVHPYRGRQQVVVTSARLSESSAEGGMAKFSLSFTESGEPVNPAKVSDTKSAVGKAADKAAAASKNSFSSLFSVDGVQDFVSVESLQSLTSAVSGIRSAASSMITGGLLSEFMLSVGNFSANLNGLMALPGDLAGGVFSLMNGLGGIASGPMGAIASLQSLFAFGSHKAVDPYATPSRKQSTTNTNAVVDLVRQTAVIEAARQVPNIIPDSYSAAITLRDSIAGQLEALAETADDATYGALTDLRLAVIKDITVRAADLHRIVSYPVPATLPALVVAHRLYANINLTDDLVARNRIAHPGFVPGGRTIEVLTP